MFPVCPTDSVVRLVVQVYKFLYACRLLDCGLFSQAFHYCELVAKALLTIQEPHIILLQEVIKVTHPSKDVHAVSEKPKLLKNKTQQKNKQ